jgi:putative transposase
VCLLVMIGVRVNAPNLVALVRAGARFERGMLVEQPGESGDDQQVA